LYERHCFFVRSYYNSLFAFFLKVSPNNNFFPYFCETLLNPNSQMTTPNKSHKLFSPLFLVAFLCVLITHKSFAQFVVKENTILTLKQDVHTLEQNNSFLGIVSGDGSLHFKGKSQVLCTSTQTNLTGISVENGFYLRIHNKIVIKGDLVIKSGTLLLDHQVIISGNIILSNFALIQNSYLLTFENSKLLELHKGVLANSSSPTFYFVNFDYKHQENKKWNHLTKLTISKYVEASYLYYDEAPIIPPPENTSFS